MAYNHTPVYVGGSRHLTPTHPTYSTIARVVGAIQKNAVPVHVGCQFGADHAALVAGLIYPSFLAVFAVAPTPAQAPSFVERAFHHGARVVFSAGGGEDLPIKARYLLRSKAAFSGCCQAVFFQPGAGSLAVAREFIKTQANPYPAVFAFCTEEPAKIPSTPGAWVLAPSHSWYSAFNTQWAQFYTWQAPEPSTQTRLF